MENIYLAECQGLTQRDKVLGRLCLCSTINIFDANAHEMNYRSDDQMPRVVRL